LLQIVLKRVRLFPYVSVDEQFCLHHFWQEEDAIKEYVCAHVPGKASGKMHPKAMIELGNVSSQPFVNAT
jgi:hypothetical protein